MANLDVLSRNVRNIDKALVAFDHHKLSRDSLLKAYANSIKQVPDNFKQKAGKENKIKPTTIAGASRNLIKAIRSNDPVMLKIDPKKYMKSLHESYDDGKGGKWILFDYQNNRPVKSDNQTVRKVVFDYHTGLHKEIELTRNRMREKENDTGLSL